MKKDNLREDAHLVISTTVETALILHPDLLRHISAEQYPDHYFDSDAQAGAFLHDFREQEPARAETLSNCVATVIKFSRVGA